MLLGPQAVKMRVFLPEESAGKSETENRRDKQVEGTRADVMKKEKQS